MQPGLPAPYGPPRWYATLSRRWKLVLWRTIPIAVMIFGGALALSRFGVAIAAAVALFLCSAANRRWLVDQPGYIVWLSRLPGWMPPTRSRFLLAVPCYLLAAAFLARLRLTTGVLVDRDDVEFSRWLSSFQYTVPGVVCAIVGAWMAFLWLVGKGPFRATSPRLGSSSPAQSQLRRLWRLDPTAWDLEPTASAQFLTKSAIEDRQAMAAQGATASGFPAAVSFSPMAVLPVAIVALAVHGAWLGVVAACLAPSVRWRRWLVRQPGYRRRLFWWRMLRRQTARSVALASLVCCALPSIAFWAALGAALRPAAPLVGSIVALGTLGTPLLWGFALRGWPVIPSFDRARSLLPRHRRWQRYAAQARALYAAGRPREALDIGKQALQVARRRSGEHSLDYANSLDTLGEVQIALGRPRDALPFLRQALRLRRRRHGDAHSEVAATLCSLGRAHAALGRYSIAQPLLRAAWTTRRAQTANELARLYLTLGDVVVARGFASLAIESIRSRHPLSLEAARATSVLGLLHLGLGDLATAHQLLSESASLLARGLGSRHFEVAAVEVDLARALLRQGNLPAAEALLKRGLEILSEVLGPAHPLAADAFTCQAAARRQRGDAAGARRLEEQALAIYEDATGGNHPCVADTLRRLTDLASADGRYADALELSTRAVAIDDQVLAEMFAVTSETERFGVTMPRLAGAARHLVLVAQQFSARPEIVQEAWDLVLRRKGVVTELAALQQRSAAIGSRPALQARLAKRSALDLRISRRALQGSGPEGVGTHQRLLSEWSLERDSIDVELARGILRTTFSSVLCGSALPAIAASVPAGTALVEFFRTPIASLCDPIAIGTVTPEEERYLAFVLTTGAPAMVDLGPAAPIDRLIVLFRSAILGSATNLAERDVWMAAGAGMADLEACGRALRAAVFDPLGGHLVECERLLLCPDGDLCLLPFQALPLDSYRHLIDAYRITYLSTGRDVLTRSDPRRGVPSLPLVVADPSFDLVPDGEPLGPPGAPVASLQRTLELLRTGPRFGALPGTRAEGERVAQMLGVSPILGDRALAGVLRRCRSPKILHIATHGFFLPHHAATPSADRLRSIANQDHPLLRCGLAFAGANFWLRAGANLGVIPEGVMNGIDIADLDLTATDLVVLSACETGLGDIEIGEGVLGLRRAFLLAGARSLVVSLWKVADGPTCDLMESFYRLLLDGAATSDALHEAQLYLKRRLTHPRYWAAFVCLGDSVTALSSAFWPYAAAR